MYGGCLLCPLYPLLVYFIANVLCFLGIRTEEIQFTALKNFQVSKAVVVGAEKIPLNVPNHRFETFACLLVISYGSLHAYA